MLLQHVTIEGYRSVRKAEKLFVEKNVTVVLGPNDHGKTNLISALQHLNPDRPFSSEDVNWDSDAVALPRIEANFALTPEEKKNILEFENSLRNKFNTEVLPVERAKENTALVGKLVDTLGLLSAQTEEDDTEEGDTEEEDTEEDAWYAKLLSQKIADGDLKSCRKLKPDDIPSSLVVRREGCGTKLQIALPETTEFVTESFLKSLVPRFELIEPFNKFTDSVTFEELERGENEFMRGIFYFAGIDPKDCKELFTQDDKTQRRLQRASQQLNIQLRESWTQGQELTFQLTHNSQKSLIELKIEDPAVTSRFVRASKRSSGFTHYFGLKTLLHARQLDNPASSYVWLFDEPGVYLHPLGQFDLLQVLETLGIENQVFYVTHSIFMINKTFPARHRLIVKNESDGTVIDGKPYSGRWKSVTNALGFSLTGTILFAQHVVLTEGESDPIYLYAIIQEAVRRGSHKFDLNSVSIMSTGDSRNADVLIRILTESKPTPSISFIIDGDEGGDARLSDVEPLVRKHNIKKHRLDEGKAIEDYLPHLEAVFLPAVASYVAEITGRKIGSEAYEQNKVKFEQSFENRDKTESVINWAMNEGKRIGGLKNPPSKVGIARIYCAKLAEVEDGVWELPEDTANLLKWLKSSAKLPIFKPAKRQIVKT